MNRDIPIPENIDIETTNNGLIIRRKWFSLKAIPIAIFAAVWDSFLFFWYSSAIGLDDAPWIMIVFPLGHVAVGIGVTYFAISSFINTTDVIISSSELRIKTYPLKWMGDKTLQISDIVSLNMKEKRGESNTSYTLNYVDIHNRQKKLISNLTEIEHAEFYLLKIRNMLGIKSEPVN